MSSTISKNIFIIASYESYQFLADNLDKILYSYDLENSNVILPFQFKTRDFISLNIENNSQNFLIESDEYIKTFDNYNLFTNQQILDLRILESKKRSYQYWLNNKLAYSKFQIPQSDTCIVIKDEDVNISIQKELKVEMNIAKQLNKQIINIDKDQFLSLNEKIKILKQKWNN
ncbi:MAG: hypothetical protein PHI05_01985 [Bacilli bacterium]|nr:hypothetical protein [Bacilli bacterium]